MNLLEIVIVVAGIWAVDVNTTYRFLPSVIYKTRVNFRYRPSLFGTLTPYIFAKQLLESVRVKGCRQSEFRS